MRQLTAEEKRRFLDALEKDREFRYAVMGLLGFRELLERFSRLEERQQKLEERQQKLEERFAELEERQQKLEERFAQLEERFAKLEERFTRLEERQQKLEKRFAMLEERYIKLEERLARVEKDLAHVRKTVERTRRDVGALTETLYSKMVLDDLKEIAKSEGERIIRRKRNFILDNVEVDLFIETERKAYAVEVKIQPNRHDVDEILEKASYIGSKIGKPCTPVLAGTWIGDEVFKYALSKNVMILEY